MDRSELFTGERALLGQIHPRLERQHLNRYRWALHTGLGSVVLDVACGTGYGSRLLANAGHPTVSIDVDYQVLSSMGADLPRVSGSLERLPIRDGAVDAVVSFETLEHVYADRLAVSEYRRVLCGDGQLLLSTPNRLVSSPHMRSCDDGKPTNPFHVREYSPEELYERLAREFSSVELYGQDFHLRQLLGMTRLTRKVSGLMLEAQGSRVSVFHQRARRARVLQPEILIAICR